MAVKKISSTEAKKIGDKLKIDWNKYKLCQFKKGLDVEQEHSDVTKGDLLKTGKIALAHIKEVPDYYTKLEKIERKTGGSKKNKENKKRCPKNKKGHGRV